MPHISTGTGDDGTTGLVGGQRTRKDSDRVEAVGAIDEANDALGLAAAFATRERLASTLSSIQEDLFTVGADLAATQHADTLRITSAHVAKLEAEEDRLEAALPPLTKFILPGGTQAAAHLFAARGIVRRAERQAWRLARQDTINPEALRYLNRLSDLLFLLGREENVLAQREETQWMGRSRKQ